MKKYRKLKRKLKLRRRSRKNRHSGGHYRHRRKGKKVNAYRHKVDDADFQPKKKSTPAPKRTPAPSRAPSRAPAPTPKPTPAPAKKKVDLKKETKIERKIRKKQEKKELKKAIAMIKKTVPAEKAKAYIKELKMEKKVADKVEKKIIKEIKKKETPSEKIQRKVREEKAIQKIVVQKAIQKEIKQLTTPKKAPSTAAAAPPKAAQKKPLGKTYSSDPQKAAERKGNHLVIEAIHKQHQVISPGIKTVDINVRTPQSLLNGRVHKDSLAFALRQVSGYHKRIQNKIIEVIDELQKAQSKSLTYEKSTYVKDPVLPAKKKPAPKPAPKFVDHEKIFDNQIAEFKRNAARMKVAKKKWRAEKAKRKAAKKAAIKRNAVAKGPYNNVEEYKTTFADTL